MAPRILSVGMIGDDVVTLHETLSEHGLKIPESETERGFFGPSTRNAVMAIQSRNQLATTGQVDTTTAAALLIKPTGTASAGATIQTPAHAPSASRAIPKIPSQPTPTVSKTVADSSGRGITPPIGPIGPVGDDLIFNVSGKVVSTAGAAAGGLRVQLVDKNVGGDVGLAVAVTDSNGTYSATFSSADLRKREKHQPDLQARVYSGDAVLGNSEVRFNASTNEILNVLLTEQASAALPSEHETLTSALSAHFKGRFRELQENSEQQDITYLANKTGWDARAVALAALADQFSARTTNGDGVASIQPAFFYALFRAGLPANENALYQIDAASVAPIWKHAIEEGVIPSDLEPRLPGVIQHYQTLVAERTLDGPAIAGVSNLRQMLSVSLGPTTNGDPYRQFAELHTRYRGDPPKFWGAVENTFGPTVATRLRVDGQLAYLTLNNAPLMARIHETEGSSGLTDAKKLAQGEYFRAEKWTQLIGTTITIPPEIPGETDDQKRALYSEVLAAQVRLSYPTAVVAQMIRSGDTTLPEGTRDNVHAFLADPQTEFEIGMHPIEQFAARKQLQLAPEVINGIQRVQRAYQITPSDKSMNALLRNGLDSACAVVRYEREEFVRTFKDEMGGETNAELTYAKSEQVYNAVLNIATTYLTARSAPTIGMNSDSPLINPTPTGSAADAADAGAVIAYPTLEGLFGELDYCTCEHCRSILSPAAYLVDLLTFCNSATNEKENPQEVLLSRRPDIQHLPLTCENTNTPVPYIDLVNETLEYFITHNQTLANYSGHDTDDSATPAELLATPQFVSDKAYEVLAGRPAQPGDPDPLLPPTAQLPFHQPLENLRRYFKKLEAPLAEVMETLRKDDNVERASADEYGWRDILMEQLGLSRDEYRLLTNGSLTLQSLFGFPSAATTADVLVQLSNVKRFTRRIGISYEEITEIIKTRFINPNSNLIPRLERLGVSFANIKDLKNGVITEAVFIAMLPIGIDPAQYGADINAPKTDYTPIVRWIKDDANYNRIMGLIVLASPSDAGDVCSMDHIDFQYANPDTSANSLKTIDFIRLQRFVRLWKKLGWTIEQTDKAISALYSETQVPIDEEPRRPSADRPTGIADSELQRLDDGFRILLPRLGVLVKVIEQLKLRPKNDLLSLLACWSTIDTHGDHSLYKTMFLSAGVQAQDSAFTDDGYGNFLQSTNQKISDHAEALRAAFSLTADELSLIVSELRFSSDTHLTLDNISAIYRRGWLARKLRLSVREFLSLIRFARIDPFVAPDPPRPSIIALLRMVQMLRGPFLKPVQALYLIWNQDITGKSAPDGRKITDFARTLRSNFGGIENDFAIADDPDGEIARSRMTLVYGSVATDFFFGLIDNTLSVSVPYSQSDSTLSQSILNTAAGRISYDDLRKQLSFSGVLSITMRDALLAVVSSNEFRTAVGELYTANQLTVGPFFARYPELLQLLSNYQASNAPAEDRRTELLSNFLPQLKRRRKRQQALTMIGASVNADTAMAQVILDDVAVLHSENDNAVSALNDLTALESAGLSAQFFWRNTATGTADFATDATPTLNYSATGETKLPQNPSPGAPISGIWSGYIEAPENGFYNIAIETDAGATVTLVLDSKSAPLVRSGNTWSNQNAIELTAGVLYSITLTVNNLISNLAVRWGSTGRGWEVIPARYLYSASLVDHLRSTYIRLAKLASLAAGLKLTPNEIGYLAAQPDYHVLGRGWANAIPTSDSPSTQVSEKLRNVLEASLDFARIKAALGPGDERLLSVLRDPAASLPNGDSLLLSLTGWENESVNALLSHFGSSFSDLAHPFIFRRVYDAQAVARKLGISTSALLKSVTNEPNANMLRDLQSALRARYGEDDFLQVVKPINDEMRNLQRDALVAYILHQMRENPVTSHIDSPDKLFEYFLMDVQMDSCMQTSRIRHALSSVQLFIERCLLNLEQQVAPSSIKVEQWEWMKRYRVWEANRKVFIWPENWLEPELRDNQSSFFKETMSELLQSDITEDTGAAALLNYLSKLEEVAKLEPCGIYYAENAPGTEDDIAHVIARTSGANRKYYYRRLEYGYWTPWELIKLDIEDNPVVPVLWNDRLILFWLRLLQKTAEDDQQFLTVSKKLTELNTTDVKAETKVKVQAILCWSEYYNGKWQPTKTSDPSQPAEIDDVDIKGQFDRSNLWLSANKEEGGLRIRIGSANGFLLYNTHSLPVRKLETRRIAHHGNLGIPSRSITTYGDTFTIIYNRGIIYSSALERPILKNRISDAFVEPLHRLGDTWKAPFFYEDNRHVFYVTTEEEIVPVSRWTNYGVVDRHLTEVSLIPPLVYPRDAVLEVPTDRFSTGMIGPGNPGVVDPLPIERFVSEDAYVNRAIATTATVTFGDVELGPGGALVGALSRS